jgi:hypothetical protein
MCPLPTRLRDAESPKPQNGHAEAQKTENRKEYQYMPIAVICFFSMLYLLDRTLRTGRIDLLVLETRHKLFALRDLLRDRAIWGGVDPNTVVFDYLDASLTWRAASLEHATIYELAGVMLSDNLKASQKGSYAALRKELDKPENSNLRAIYDSYQACMEQYFHARHKFLLPLLRTVAVSFWAHRERKPSATVRSELKQESLELLTTEPKHFSHC